MRFLPMLGLLLATALTALASDPHVRVQASRALQICIVDSAKTTPARSALHRDVGRALAQVLSQDSGEPLEVRVETVDSAKAAARLTGGNCDAVLVFGASRPRVLQRLEAVTLAGNLGPERQGEPAYLILGSDPALARLLAAGFPAALAKITPPAAAVVAAR